MMSQDVINHTQGTPHSDHQIWKLMMPSCLFIKALYTCYNSRVHIIQTSPHDKISFKYISKVDIGQL